MIIATYNLHLCQEPDALLYSVLKSAKEELVDVFCFQEAVRNTDGSLFTDTLAEKLGEDWKIVSHVGEEPSWYSIGNVTIWNSKRLMHKRSTNIVLPANGGSTKKEAIFSKLIAGDVYEFKRRSIISEFIEGETSLQIANIHLDNIGGSIHRNKQLNFMLKHLNSKITYSIVCGDFNTFDLKQTGNEVVEMKKILGDEYIDISQDSGWTGDLYRVNFQKANPLFAFIIKNFRIHLKRKLDYIFVKGGQRLSLKKLDLPGSDHLPLIASLRRKNT